MSIKNNIYVLKMLIILVLASIFIVSVPQTAHANTWSSAGSMELINSYCPAGSEQFQELNQLKKEITAADTLSQARKMALAPTDGAIEALRNARNIMPFSDDLRSAETRLSDARSRILVASSQAQVADEFEGMMLAGLDDNSVARVSAGGGSCSYSTGETIAIVIGLILGIIPGLILLVLLC
ncbi:MAG: hypothetical protein LUQ57_06630 [Methylococcaceae bacterium]|nr:hypothetical protein [Methylococcaceae bacterium]